mmetsp:Transcript_18832/g.41941  ORF Transcript_18832/g.41941 Transcript_18832/m.41941 type:complete len:309 (+) Transcript_18832:311-1237(+)
MVKFASSVAILLLLAVDSCHAFTPTNRRTSSISRIARVEQVALSHDIHRREEATQLHAKPFAASALPAASLATISALELTTGGVFSGSLHAIAGPDHLAALIPRCCGLKWYSAARVGAIWGLGHGFSATLLGMAGFLLKKGVNLTGFGGFGLGMDWTKHAGSAMELAIGISLIIIGLLGVKEAREWSSPSGSPQSLSSAASPEALAVNPNQPTKRVLLNGLLHGFSWDGAPSLAPAVAVSSWKGSLTFLLAYAFGTMATMTLATTVIGEGTCKAAGKLDRPDLPRDLSVASSFLALIVGVVWCWLAVR